MNSEWKLTADGWVRVPKNRGTRVELGAAIVRGSTWKISYPPKRGRFGRPGALQDWHQPVSGTGRRTPARGGSVR